jgi:hypothetical protein
MRVHPRAGRLDLLLQDPETKRRYEVELQLGSTDEAHIIRTIEYWDIERKRYPQYDHCAVLIAEDITSRFLNVVSLFNGTIPLIAIQMQALKIGDNVTLVFTTVMDELSRGYIDADEDAEAAPTDRAYWEKRGSKGYRRACGSVARTMGPIPSAPNERRCQIEGNSSEGTCPHRLRAAIVHLDQTEILFTMGA